MKLKKMDWPAVLIEMLNCIIVQYALSNMAILLHANLLFVLLFMAKMWTWSSCWRKMDDLCGNKVLSAVLTAGCMAAEMGLFCFVWKRQLQKIKFPLKMPRVKQRAF